MSEFWSKSGYKIKNFFIWAADNHFGKLIGTVLGLLFGLLFAILGFWRALVLIAFVAGGFYLGKIQDEQGIKAWLKKRFP